MKFTHFNIPLEKTSYLKQIALDYLHKKPSLKEFYGLHPTEANHWQRQIEVEDRFQRRSELVQALRKQYQNSGIDLNSPENEKVKSNLEALLSDDTFTITSGQQIHIFLGPVFVWYKMYSLITLAKEATDQLADKRIVPVFWMATEDHDLEEISEVNLYNETYQWETTQKGAVGRMHTNGLTEIADQLLERIDDSSLNKDFLKLCRDAYEQSENLSQASRKIIHETFKSFGLLVIDPDDDLLKESFNEVVSWDLYKRGSQTKIEAVNEKLAALGYTPQINGRDINFFLLDKDSRKRVDKRENGFVLIDEEGKEEKFYPEKHPTAMYSPNALLRPLYQEYILPNIAYVAGGSEIAYWLQLKPIFDHWKRSFPLLFLRSHGMIMHQKLLNKLIKKAPLESYFLPVKTFRESLLQERRSEKDDLKESFESIQKQLNVFKESLEKSAFASHVAWKEFSSSFHEVEKLAQQLDHAIDDFFEKNEEIKPALAQKERFFDREIQERHRSGINYLHELHLLQSTLNPLPTHSLWTDQARLNIFVTE